MQVFRKYSRFFLGPMGAALLFVACTGGVTEKHMNLAEDYLRQGQYLRAIEEYSRVVNFGQRSPTAIKAQERIAWIYDQQLKDYPRAIRAYRDVLLRSDEAREKIAARLAVAKIYSEKLENPASASEEFSILYKEFGKDHAEGPFILASLARTLVQTGRYKEASLYFKQFQEFFPGHVDGPRMLLEEAQALLSDRQTETAIAVFQKVIGQFKGQRNYDSLVGEAYFGLGNAFEDSDNLPAALEAYKEGLFLYPNKKVIELKLDRVTKRFKAKKI